MSSQIRQNYPTEVKVTVNGLANLHLRASHTYLSLGFYFYPEDVALRGHGPLLPELVEKKPEGTEKLLHLQNKCGGCILSQDMLKPSQDEWVKLRTHGSHLSLGEEPEPGPLGAAGSGFYHTDPQLRDFLEKHFLDEEVKLIKKMGNHLTHLHKLSTPSWAHPQA